MATDIQEAILTLEKAKNDYITMDPIHEIVGGPRYDFTEHNAEMVRMIDETIGYLSNLIS
jgi:hypothetical protein